MPSKPFVYVAGRPYLSLSRALTQKKGDQIVDCLGKTLDVKFLSGTTGVSSTKAQLVDYVKIPLLGEGYGLEWEVFDWIYRFHLKPEDPSIVRDLLSRKDGYIQSSEGFQKAVAHWGTQRWSGLTMDMGFDDQSFVKTDVDVFGP
jgi:hypothetical protein